jgi:hypothetical protein
MQIFLYKQGHHRMLVPAKTQEEADAAFKAYLGTTQLLPRFEDWRKGIIAKLREGIHHIWEKSDG